MPDTIDQNSALGPLEYLDYVSKKRGNTQTMFPDETECKPKIKKSTACEFSSMQVNFTSGVKGIDRDYRGRGMECFSFETTIWNPKTLAIKEIWDVTFISGVSQKCR